MTSKIASRAVPSISRESPAPLPNGVRDLCTALLASLRGALGEKLFAVYLYGALAFADGGAIGDVDFHVILNTAPSERDKAALERLHGLLARAFPPLGAELDGYYIMLAEARQSTPPRHQLASEVVDESWALHCAHMRAGRCVILQGPDPRQIYPEVTWPELKRALLGELEYVTKHLTDYPAYCVLNLCRLVYSFETKEVVVSKFAAANWAREAFPPWSEAIAAALRCYEGNAGRIERKRVQAAAKDFLAFARSQIGQICHSPR
jgi:hypothetical protein